MVQIFISREKAEKLAKNVNDYLIEQQMCLRVDVVELDGKYVVAIANCYQQEMFVMKCAVCGKEIGRKPCGDDKEFYGICDSTECFRSRFWDIALDGNEIIINGECYHIGKEPTRTELNLHSDYYGFGGEKFRIKRFDDKEVIVTHNLRHNGKVPVDRHIQDTAEFLSA